MSCQQIGWHNPRAGRNAHLHAITSLTRYAIRSRELTPILREAVRVTVETLGAEGGAILQKSPSGTPLLRAGLGWNDEALCHAVQVNISGRNHAWGVLAIRRPHAPLNSEEMEFLESVANVVALSIERNHRTESPLQEHELLQTIFDHIPVMISYRDPANHLLYVNGEWERTLGWTLEDARNTDILPMLYPDPDARRRALDFFQSDDRTWTDFQPWTRDGRQLDTSWARFRLSNGCSIGFGLDNTKRKEQENALADSEARFARVFQATPVALAISTIADGRIIDVNERWLAMFGYEREEVIGRTNAELGLSLSSAAREETIRQIRASGVLRNVEVRARRKSGEIRDLIVSAVPITLAGGSESWISSQVDDTDRKRAEVARDQLQSITDSALQSLGLDDLLQELLSRVRGALDASYASVALIDAKRQELYIRAVSGRSYSDVSALRSPLGHGVSGKVAADGTPRIIHNLDTVDLSRISGTTPEKIRALSRSVIAVPLRAGGKIVGVVTASAPNPHHFNDEHLTLLLVVADRAAPAIERARLIETVNAARERMKALSARLLRAQEEERRRIAVELHDELGQVLTAVKITLHTIVQKLDTQTQCGLAEAIESVDQALERIRNLALDLRPAMLDDLGLCTALRWYANRFTRDTGIEVHFCADAVPRLDAGLETACFRVVQEALTNVMRHADARHVWVELRAAAGETELKIRDDGIGFDVHAARERAASGVSVGILGMEERVSLMGGELEVHSRPGEGTRLSARFPTTGRT